MTIFEKLKVTPTRLPNNYKAKKFNHVTYIDVENISQDDTKLLKDLRIFEINVAGHTQQIKKITALKALFKCLKFNFTTFETPSKNRADDILLAQHRRDLQSYRACEKLVFLILTRDKKLISQFIEQGKREGAYYRVISPPLGT